MLCYSAVRLGADNVVISTDIDQMSTNVNNKFDQIIDTLAYIHDVNPYMPSLLHNGALMIIGFLGNLDEYH